MSWKEFNRTDDVQCRLPLVITEQLLKKLQRSTFAILDKQGHPVACGFFVTPCGMALTAARNAVFLRPPLKRGGKKVFTASTCAMHEFHLEVVVPKVGALDIAVLRVIPCATLPPRDHLSLPPGRIEAYKLFGAYCTMIHCCVAWSDNEKAALVAHETGYIVTSSENMLLYRVTSYERHSGAAIMFSSGQVIGLHSQPVNDGECDPSGLSYNTSGEAVRLDVPAIKEAVEGAKIGGEVLDKTGETLFFRWIRGGYVTVWILEALELFFFPKSVIDKQL